LLFDARAAAVKLAENYEQQSPVEEIRLPGPTGYTALDMALHDMHKQSKATDYDMVVGASVAKVLSGGDKADWTKPISEQDILTLEYNEFCKLVKNDGTKDRVEHMLKTGKPLRN
jgi:3-hydroxyacyl-CoA dehydrogenase